MRAQQGFGGGALHEGARLRVDGRAEKIVGGGVANVELDGGVELGEFDEIGLAKVAGFDRRLGGEGSVRRSSMALSGVMRKIPPETPPMARRLKTTPLT